ncbi:TPA: VENN motif pre-toxin domain-containing protein [Citrobacter amalonaticus]|nr:VENN motif pre-toxin domain-containing protein [Citrobacter amalonaticus]
MSALYGKDVSQLTADEKRLVSSLVTIAGGLAGAAITDGDLSMAALASGTAKVEVENNSLSLGSGMDSYVNAAASWNQFATTQGLSPEETQAGLDKIAKGELPEGANIAKVIVEGYQDGVMIAGAWYLGPAASVGKMVSGGVIAEIANGSYQWFDLSQPGNENKNWDWKSSASSGIAGMLAPGRTIGQNVGIAMGGAFFTDGPNTGSIGGAAIGAWFGGKFGEFAPFPGEVNDLIGGIGGEVISNKIKDKVSENEK